MPRLKDIGKVKDSFFIPLDKLVPDSEQPRTLFREESIATLANSLVLEGQHTPIVVRLGPNGEHAIIVHGERRWRAANYANENLMGEIEGLYAVAEQGRGIQPDKRFVSQITNNDEQESLTVIEKAYAYKKLIDKFGYTVKQVAESVHRSDQHIYDMLKLVEAPEEIQDAVNKGAISPTAAVKTAKARKEVQQEVKEKLESGEGVSIKDVEERIEDGVLKPLSAKEIAGFIKKADDNMNKSKSRERDRWQAIKYGLETAIGMHEW